jgi:hypothetical protein
LAASPFLIPARPPRRALLAALGASLAAAGCGAEAVPGARGPLATPFDIAVPRGARLQPLGGLRIDRERLGFGGLSGLHIDAALRVTAVSDLAHWMSARLVVEDGRPVGLADLRTGRLGDVRGRPLARGHTGDAESLARAADGTWLVGFERWHRIRAYRDLSGPGRYVEAPPGLGEAPRNGGLESLAVLADGRWLAITEMLAADPDGATRRGWIGGPGRWVPVAYRPGPGGFVPTDAHGLPDGGALVLERSFSWLFGWQGRLVRISAATLAGARRGTVFEGEELLRFDPPLPEDNWEGVAAVRHQGGLLVAVVSDDNQRMLQSTMLLLFRMVE